jgi:hypothetical protein
MTQIVRTGARDEKTAKEAFTRTLKMGNQSIAYTYLVLRSAAIVNGQMLLDFGPTGSDSRGCVQLVEERWPKSNSYAPSSLRNRSNCIQPIVMLELSESSGYVCRS